MVLAAHAAIHIDPRKLMASPWAHDIAHELVAAKLRAIKALEGLGADVLQRELEPILGLA